MTLPTWCQELVLAALNQALFEPIEIYHLKYLTSLLAGYYLRMQSF